MSILSRHTNTTTITNYYIASTVLRYDYFYKIVGFAPAGAASFCSYQLVLATYVPQLQEIVASSYSMCSMWYVYMIAMYDVPPYALRTLLLSTTITTRLLCKQLGASSYYGLQATGPDPGRHTAFLFLMIASYTFSSFSC